MAIIAELTIVLALWCVALASVAFILWLSTEDEIAGKAIKLSAICGVLGSIICVFS